jgi:hypothetical protein
MMPFPIFGIGNQGRSLDVDAQIRTNLYVEVNQDPEKNILTLYPTAGLSLFSDFGASPCRGIWEVSGVLYVVNQNKLYALLNNGMYISIGTLLTSDGLVSMTDNGNQICIVDGTYGYIYDRSTLTFTRITDSGFPTNPQHVDFSDGRFVTNKGGTGQFYISAQYDGLTWGALDFATAEASPDNLVRVISDSGILLLMGDKTIEPWGNSGALDFPYARIGSGAIEWGLAARWSLCKYMDSLIFLRKNRLGQVQVCIHQAGAAKAVSTPEMDATFAQYPATSDAVGFAYMANGHPFYQITFPTAGESWLFDGQSQSWSKLSSNGGRHKALLYAQLLDKKLVTDYQNGKIYQLKDDVYTDNGDAIAREFITKHVGGGDYSTIASLWLEMEAGTGTQTGQGYDPQIMMTVSRDGGHTYGSEQWQAFGKTGEYTRRAKWNRIGRARNWVFKFRITDPVKTVITQAWAQKYE